MLQNIMGSFLVVLIIFLISYCWHFFDLRTQALRHLSTSFSIPTLRPHTPQDYILLGQKIDINTAPAELLETLPGIGPSLAERIIKYRVAHGAFANVDDLDNVSGIGQKVIFRLKPYVITK